MSPEPITGAATKAAQTGFRGLEAVLRAGAHTKRNDRLALRAFEDLKDWAGGERRAQDDRLRQVDRDIDDDWYYTEIHLRRQAEAREPSIEGWRRENLKTQRRLEDLRDTENVIHTIVRRVRRRPWPPANPFRDATDTLVHVWERGVTPRHVAPPRGELASILKHSPGLRQLYQDAAAVTDPRDTPSFCANRVWYGRLKPRLVELVGFDAQHEELRTTRAYDIAYQGIYALLPDCRSCGELGMPPD